MLQGTPVLIVWFVFMATLCMADESPTGRREPSDPKAIAKGPDKLRVYIGTYTNGKSRGIYLLEMNTRSGELRRGGLAAEVAKPSFLVLHPERPLLYAVGELSEFEGHKSGAVSAFSISPEDGKLRLLNQQPSGGQGPCYVAVSPTGGHVLVANYSNGSVASLPIREDGGLDKPVSVIQHEGSGPNTKRQQGPHAHSIQPDPAGRYVLAADLGADKLFVYRFNPVTGGLEPNEPPALTATPGAGPRHFTFHPSGRFVYANNELASTVTAMTYAPDRGILRVLQTESTLPDGFEGENTTAQVCVHPSGRFLYVSNRGHDSIAIFGIDAATGRLKPAGHAATRGKTPRNFNIDPSGRWLLAANQQSDSLAVFRIDPANGRLEPAALIEGVPTPVCVLFAPAEGAE